MTASPGETDKTATSSLDAPTVLFRTINHVGIISLNRPTALNALDLSMIHQIAEKLEECRSRDDIGAVVLHSSIEKAFCAGGDVRALIRPGSDSRANIERYFTDEYRLDYAIHQFPKPVVVLMDGVTMGGGMGLAQGASLRVATDRSKIAMPETKIGLVPDVGATHFLSVMPVELELYVGLTGITLSGTDAVACGLADICIPHRIIGGFEDRIADIDTHAISKGLHSFDAWLAAMRGIFEVEVLGIEAAPVMRCREWIEAHFKPDRAPQEILSSLKRTLAQGIEDTSDLTENAELRAWLETTLAALTQYSPTMIHVTREALLRGRQMTLAECFRMEMGIVIRSIEEGDFREGVRAHLVDKDRNPKWQVGDLSDVTSERVQAFMTSPWQIHPLVGLETIAHV